MMRLILYQVNNYNLYLTWAKFDSRSRGTLFESFNDLNFWAQEMNIRGSTRPRCALVPLKGDVCAVLIFLSAVCWLHTQPGVSLGRPDRWFPGCRPKTGEVNVKGWLSDRIVESDPIKNC